MGGMGKESIYVSVHVSVYVSVAGGVVLELMPEMLQRASVMYVCLLSVCQSVCVEHRIQFTLCLYLTHYIHNVYCIRTIPHIQ